MAGAAADGRLDWRGRTGLQDRPPHDAAHPVAAHPVSAPAAALREAGIVVPEGVHVAVLQDTPGRVHLVLPPPEEGALSDSELDGVAGGLSVLPRPKRLSPRNLFRMME